MDAMTTAGTLDATAAAALPKVSGTPVYPTADQQTKAGTYISAHWKAAVG
jgi:putative spermidine/putrescine transport system substrate-binding protein